MLGIDQQIARMAEFWPMLELVSRQGPTAIWQGPLRPLLQTFIVQIVYRAPLAIEVHNNRRLQPLVRIIVPPLRPRHSDREGQLPHVYYVGEDPLDVVLCMFDPDSTEWSPWMSVAETTVLWTIDWLTSYEGWRATGQWTGGGKHFDAGALRQAVTP
jgi:hypothetical protein